MKSTRIQERENSILKVLESGEKQKTSYIAKEVAKLCGECFDYTNQERYTSDISNILQRMQKNNLVCSEKDRKYMLWYINK